MCTLAYNAQVGCALLRIGKIKLPVDNAPPSCKGSIQEDLCRKNGKGVERGQPRRIFPQPFHILPPQSFCKGAM